MNPEIIAVLVGGAIGILSGFIAWLTRISFNVGWIKSTIETQLASHEKELNSLDTRVATVEQKTATHEARLDRLIDD
ncbi:hypothetical protein [Thalassoglobus polymorphus]|uniref:Uncharacterized protein n=1 Tax=Thalassoglobus polymorphus TaxID=2527994 RepID=A0A517QH08_9PLAN|nr:hypothetical protein [Thalassoglobus polymorphus]QDT30919.1 hypothetical protein Mal48_01480 [Thalassoglobus polymorphus]QDT30964.1 hypothetical protein Mal48_01930 [Thalassoglobus polymorphus]